MVGLLVRIEKNIDSVMGTVRYAITEEEIRCVFDEI